MKALVTAALAFALGLPAMAGETDPQTEMTDTVCTARTLPVYFSPGSTNLGEAAKSAIAKVGDTFGPCQVAGVETSALASDASSANELEHLLAHRQLAVLDALQAANLLGHGVGLDLKPTRLENTSSSVPGTRRVDVTFHLVPPAMG